MLRPSFEMVGRFQAHTLPDDSTVYYEPDPKHAYFGEVKPSRSAEGGYSFVRASRLTGVSTIAKYLDVVVDPLMHWSAKLDQIGIAELASLALDADGDLTWLREQGSIAAALREAKATWTHVRDRAAIRGTNIHELIFLALAKEETPPSLASLSDAERGYGQAAMRWWLAREPRPIAAEQVTVSYDKGFAGRFDLLCEIEGERVLVDAKTREKGRVRKSDHVQLPGYEDANIACGIGPSDRQLILILMPDGTYREEWGVGTREDFYAALVACQAGRVLDKRMRDAEKEAVPA